MHELALCQALVTKVEALAREHAARRAIRIVVAIGPLSGVEAPLLERAFSIARAGTVADAATLVCEPLAIRIRCSACRRESDGRPNDLRCPHCREVRTELIAGDALLLMRVELEDD